MDWQEKLGALQELGDCSLRMREPGNWYVSHNTVNVNGGLYGNGESPEEAVEDHWRKLATDLPGGETIQIGLGSGKAREVIWTGHMWKDVPRND